MHALATAFRVKRSLVVALVVLALTATSPASSQPEVAEGRLASFEYSSVLPSHPAAGPIVTISPASGDFTALGVSLKQLIGYAYDVPPSRVVGGPDWVESAHYEVRAYARSDFNSDEARVTPDEVRPLVIGLLVDHFGLEAHVEQAPLETVIIDRVGNQPKHDPAGQLLEVAPRP